MPLTNIPQDTKSTAATLTSGENCIQHKAAGSIARRVPPVKAVVTPHTANVTTPICDDLFIQTRGPTQALRGAPQPVEDAREGLAKLGLLLEQDAIESTPERRQSVQQSLSDVRLALNKVDRWLTEKLKLDEMVVEVGIGIEAGLPGFVRFGVTPTLVFSGAKTGKKKRINFYAAPSAGLQAVVATGGIVWLPGADPPVNYSLGAGPVRYKIHDSVHNGPNVGVSIPLVCYAVLGPKMLGISLSFGIPWMGVAKWNIGGYVSHPWLRPMCGSIWHGGERLVELATTITAPIRDVLRPYIQGTK